MFTGKQQRGGGMVRLIVGVLIGATLGFAYFRLVGCSSGLCPITANPYISTLYGALIGALLSGAWS